LALPTTSERKEATRERKSRKWEKLFIFKTKRKKKIEIKRIKGKENPTKKREAKIGCY